VEADRKFGLLGANAQFTTTRWSVIVNASEHNDGVAREALEQLCRLYWYPLYAFTRRRGYGAEDAQDLTQAFFEQMIEKNSVGRADRERGKFRVFLLAAYRNFLADEWDRSKRIKRGGAQSFISLDGATADERYRLEPASPEDAAKLFDRKWATTLLDSALTRLGKAFSTPQQQATFRELSPFLIGEQGDETYTELAVRLSTTTAAIKMSISRMRASYREILREEILQTVSTAEEAEEEYLALKAALRP
jgi:DNA-directed RNA polymerase specialized sigma24 family protein